MNISSLIVNIRNASKANKIKTTIQNSRANLTFIEILRNHKFILGYSHKPNNKVEVYLKYNFKKPCILNILNLNKTSTPLYLSLSDLWKFEKDLGFVVLNTSKGIITHKNALKNGVGGKALAYVI